jgi:hypothetical protein
VTEGGTIIMRTIRSGVIAAAVLTLLAMSPAAAGAADPGPAEPDVVVQSATSASVSSDLTVSPMAVSTRTYSGDFKASLRSSTIYNGSTGTITASVTATNCTAGYGSITVDLYNVTVVTQVISYGKQTVPCGSTRSVSWTGCNWGSYQLQFDRTGPAGKDENTKHVTGTIWWQQ